MMTMIARKNDGQFRQTNLLMLLSHSNVAFWQEMAVQAAWRVGEGFANECDRVNGYGVAFVL
jgi:hypothetical protein